MTRSMIIFHYCNIIIFLFAVLSVVRAISKENILVSRRELLSRDHDLKVEEVISQISRRARAKRDVPDSNGVSFTQTNLNDSHTVANIVYSGLVNSEVIFILTFNRGDQGSTSSNVYLTTDYGMTYQNITNRIGNGATLNPPVRVDPIDHKTVYFVAANTPSIFISTDEGQTFTTRRIMPSNINRLSITPHSTMPGWLLAQDTNNALYVSRDLGETPFIKLSDDVDSFSWGEYPYDRDNSTVYFLSNDVLYTQEAPYTDSSKKRFDSSLDVYESFVLVDRYIFIGNSIDGTDFAKLYVSANRGPFQEAKLPTQLSSQGYIVDSIRSVQALVIAILSNNNFNLYFSEEQGVYYYESLARLVVVGPPPSFSIDLSIDEGSNFTTYIANQWITNLVVFKRTLISFDAGANWNLVTPPEDNETDCELPLCSLHLHMTTSNFWRTGVYSQESAPGIIVAHGLTARYMTIRDDTNVDLYMSTDGGSTWTFALEGSWGVDVLDHGALIVAARDHNNGGDESRTLMYTCDEGISWSSLTFVSEDITIFGVVTEPGETTTVVSIFGTNTDGNWLLVVINFMNIFTSQCQPDDYYAWTHIDKYSENGCFLGANVTIERRKPDVCCLNGHTYNRVINYTTCSCTLEDYECDYGYYRANSLSGTACIRDNDVILDNCNANGYYSHSLGYRKIGGDVCAGGIESSLLPLNLTCPRKAGSSSSSSSAEKAYLISLEVFVTLFVLAIVIILVLIVGFVVYVKINKPASQFDHQQFTDTTSATDAELKAASFT